MLAIYCSLEESRLMKHTQEVEYASNIYSTNIYFSYKRYKRGGHVMVMHEAAEDAVKVE